MSWTNEVNLAFDNVFTSKISKKIAVFDADGTLWHDDIGDEFFKWQIQNALAPGLKGVIDPWMHYKDLCKKDTATGYGWLAQINSGLREEELLEQTSSYFKDHFLSKIDSRLRKLIQKLNTNDFEIWICTASIKWAVIPALTELKLATKFIIGTEVELDQEKKLTQKVVTPIPYQAGKKYWLEKKLSHSPLLVAGNSLGDLDMMGLATILPLTIVYKPHLEAVKESELALLEKAKSNNWPIQIFQQ
jgi:phosphoserine phosphatase